MNDQNIARRYAKAIYELALESGKLDETGGDLNLAAEALKATPQLLASLDSPSLTRDQKNALVESFIAAGHLGETVANALRLLAQRNRFALIPFVSQGFDVLKDEHDGVVRAALSSACPLSQSQLEAIQSDLGKGLGKKVIVHATVDPSLLGGVMVDVAGKTLDGTIKGRLNALARALRNG